VPSVELRRQLTADDVRAVGELADRLETEFGAPPLNDQALTRLGDQHDALLHLLDHDGDSLLGYAQVLLDGDAADAEVAVRSDGVNRLVSCVERLADHRGVRIWAHGRHSPVGPALDARGYDRHRVLWQLRRPLTGLPFAPLPQGVRIRPFVPGRDEQAWLAVNAAAFAHHAEQGGWTLPDLLAREAAAWFDPAGFLLAWRRDELLGYHWTKVHADGLGEVYVLGIAPAAQGMRLGSALLDAGLAYLAQRGCTAVLLYVDDDNDGAMRLYARSGFERYDRDTQYLRRLAVG
jgi:mycothiol synthase